MKTRNIRDAEKEILKLTPSLAERVYSLEKAVERLNQNILDGLAEEDKKRKPIYNYNKSLLSDKDIDDMVSVYEAGYDTTPKKVGVDDSEEIELEEMDINNILRALDYFKEHNSICNVWTTGQLIEKLNKMLKEKGNEEE